MEILKAGDPRDENLARRLEDQPNDVLVLVWLPQRVGRTWHVKIGVWCDKGKSRSQVNSIRWILQSEFLNLPAGIWLTFVCRVA